MKKGQLLTALAILGLMATSASAQQGLAQAPATPSQARIEVPEVSFNFGYVPQGASISHTFWLRSVGGDTLRITDVRPG